MERLVLLAVVLAALLGTVTAAQMYCLGSYGSSCSDCHMYPPSSDTMEGGMLVAGTYCYATGGYIGQDNQSSLYLFSSFMLENGTDSSLLFVGYSDINCQAQVFTFGAGAGDSFAGFLNVAGTAMNIYAAQAC